MLNSWLFTIYINDLDEETMCFTTNSSVNTNTDRKASYEDSVYVAGGVQKDLDVLIHETDLTCG